MGCARLSLIRADDFTTKFGLRSMKSLRKILLSSGVVLLALSLLPLSARTPQQGFAAAAQAQNPQPPPQQPQQPGVRVQVEQVIVPVTVKDGSGRLVPDLRKDEFRILEDNVEQRIVSFSADAVPLSLVVLVDNDLKSKDARQVAESLNSIVAGCSSVAIVAGIQMSKPNEFIPPRNPDGVTPMTVSIRLLTRSSRPMTASSPRK